MRSTLIAILVATAAVAVGVTIFVVVGDIIYHGAQPPQSFIKLASFSLLPLAIGAFTLARQSAKNPGGLLDRLAKAAIPKSPKTPRQRIFALVAILGLLICTFTIANYAWEGHSNFIEKVPFGAAWYMK